ncbi:SLATT domain-containing protein [Nocardia sp. NPDC058499]|uniref:SLATT domain-containing protein n=1 Tax=Nocardia sp. NPDC058499 TaxID=3346530 RepID=UPI003663384F
MNERVRGQVDRYYRPRAAEMNRRQRRLHKVQLAFTAAAVVLGAISSVFQAGWASAWVATVTTMTAAVTADIAATRYAYQELEFSRTAAELETPAARTASHPRATRKPLVAAWRLCRRGRW